MSGTVISHEIEVDVPASEAWKLYGTLQFGEFLGSNLPDLIAKVDVVQGDGGVGTIIQVFFIQGNVPPGLTSYKEKFMIVDHEKRVKEVQVVEGAYLDLGFTLYRLRIEVIEIEGMENKCITKMTIEYEVKKEALDANNASIIAMQPQLLNMILPLAADHLVHNYNSNTIVNN